MNFNVEFTPRAQRQLDGLQREQQFQLYKKIVALEQNPRPAGAIKLKGFKDLWRIRTGNFRIIYRIFETRLVVTIIKVSKRDEGTYKGL